MTDPIAVRRADVYRELRRVVDPELGMNVVKLGLVYEVTIADGAITVVMTLTTRGCPLAFPITDGVRTVLSALPWAQAVDVRLVWDPPWTPARIRWAADDSTFQEHDQ